MGVKEDSTYQLLVSVIITTYNRSKYLEECLISIVNQTYSNIEVLIIDDGSKKENAIKNELICTKFPNCFYNFKENSGQPASRNFGIKKSKGEYIAFCDDDDYWALDKLEKQVAVLNKNSDYGLVTANIEYILNDGTKTGKIKSHKGENHGDVFKSLLLKNRTASIIPLLRKEIFSKVGFFNPAYTIAEDWEFWRRVSYYYKFYFIDEVLAYVRLHGENMSGTRTGSVLERYKLYRKLTNSLLSWGKDRFSEKEIIHIKYIEWCFYRRLFSNNLGSMKKKIQFLVSIRSDLLKLMRLYLINNKYYKVQK